MSLSMAGVWAQTRLAGDVSCNGWGIGATFGSPAASFFNKSKAYVAIRLVAMGQRSAVLRARGSV